MFPPYRPPRVALSTWRGSRGTSTGSSSWARTNVSNGDRGARGAPFTSHVGVRAGATSFPLCIFSYSAMSSHPLEDKIDENRVQRLEKRVPRAQRRKAGPRRAGEGAPGGGASTASPPPTWGLNRSHRRRFKLLEPHHLPPRRAVTHGSVLVKFLSRPSGGLGPLGVLGAGPPQSAHPRSARHPPPPVPHVPLSGQVGEKRVPGPLVPTRPAPRSLGQRTS